MREVDIHVNDGTPTTGDGAAAQRPELTRGVGPWAAVGLAIFMNVALGGVLTAWHVDGEFLGMHGQVSGLTLVALATIWAQSSALASSRIPFAMARDGLFSYAYVPLVFLVSTAALLVNTFVAAPRQVLQGVIILLAGLPFYWWWSRQRSAG